MKKLMLVVALFFSLNQTSNAGLLGVELSLKSIFKSASSSTVKTISFLTTATVVEPEVEFPSLGDLDVDGDSFNLVDVSINAGDDFIEIDFGNASSGRFSFAFENTYVFKFDSVASVNIISAEIDSSVTTLRLTPSDIRVDGDELFINVEGLRYKSSTFVRINLDVENESDVNVNPDVENESDINVNPDVENESDVNVNPDPENESDTNQCLASDPAIGTISSDLDIHMPSLNYQSLEGLQSLWVNFEYYGEGSNGELLWKLKEFGANPVIVKVK